MEATPHVVHWQIINNDYLELKLPLKTFNMLIFALGLNTLKKKTNQPNKKKHEENNLHFPIFLQNPEEPADTTEKK